MAFGAEFDGNVSTDTHHKGVVVTTGPFQIEESPFGSLFELAKLPIISILSCGPKREPHVVYEVGETMPVGSAASVAGVLVAKQLKEVLDELSFEPTEDHLPGSLVRLLGSVNNVRIPARPTQPRVADDADGRVTQPWMLRTCSATRISRHEERDATDAQSIVDLHASLAQRQPQQVW